MFSGNMRLAVFSTSEQGEVGTIQSLSLQMSNVIGPFGLDELSVDTQKPTVAKCAPMELTQQKCTYCTGVQIQFHF